MKIVKSLLPLAVFLTVLCMGGMLACQNLNKEDLFGIQCDTTSVSYSADIEPILQSNCLHCHYDGTPVAPFSLQGFKNVLIRVNTGELEGAVNHLPGSPQMPRDGPKLPECELSLINKWIREGAPNN
ncbi:MAG TPA: hypothetical protein ENI20_09945 [Bacteroides sp.]|nr:hypothetical protein [Bacteroides sp.]